ncbi:MULTISPECIES: ABC transporter permease [unclassified Sphingopyxis]|uniref:ABC transporter permease n=1 Tax=unclassified Sphingopyxis TaxID=2614943 RepID=UPI000736509F|nr:MULTISPECIES: ABC transporter permease [unclassified Sphingopyxis]KTE45698.1 sodium ABC transporter permease [Sphingopyxis sp. HIX]KTE85624.1 sodium ABC transporter permease [Sphingopyxis sp. HXXIV]
MTPFLKNMFVVARRDFLAIVATPTFLLFLLAPLFMIGMGLAGGMGASQLADSARGAGRIVVVADATDAEALRDADTRLRAAMPREPATLVVRIATPAADPVAITKEKGSDTYAVMSGPLDAPRIVEREPESASGRYLSLLAGEVIRARAAGDLPAVAPRFESLSRGGNSIALQQSLGFGAVFAIFLLTLLLAGQTVSSLAEEKGNKVIEILAAAVPLESVFLGKLLGFLGVAILFIAFWIVMAFAGGFVAAAQMDPAMLDATGRAGKAAAALSSMPATGWGFFLGIGFVYFILSFLLLGAVFLGVGAQAATVREIQMLSLPITIFQVGMFSLSAAAASAPGSGLATFAQIFPFSSPLAMAARAATDEAKSVHLLALGWQALWVALVIFISVRLFRAGVLSGRSDWRFWRRKKGA